jgi:hypothetical protein
MATSTINLNSLLKHAVKVTRDNEDWTLEQIIAELLTNHVGMQELSVVSFAAEKTAATTTKEKKTRTRSAPAKERAIPDDDIRCNARTVIEKDHLENGKLKMMRDDADNLYGDRCKCKKSGDTDFCKTHSEKQTLGVWGGEYAGKFKVYVEKTESTGEVQPKQNKPKVEKPKQVTPEVVSDSEAEEDEAEVKIQVQPKMKPTEKPKAKPAPTPAPKIEEPEEAEVEEVEIDGVMYYRDSDDCIYNPEDDEEIGQYNFKTKKWVKGGPQ